MANARKLQSTYDSATVALIFYKNFNCLIELFSSCYLLWRFNDSFTMLHKSKTAEIDRVLKKVDEGADFFDEIWAKGMCFGYRSFELVIRAC